MVRPDTTLQYWCLPADEVLRTLESCHKGLSVSDAAERLQYFGRNTISGRQQGKFLRLFLNRFLNPLVLILICAASIAVVLHDWLDATIVLAIVFISNVLSFMQERHASNAVEKLRRRVSAKTTVIRDGQMQIVLSEDVVPGDIVQLTAGSLVPADGILLEARDFFVSQAILTGETFPVEKQPGLVSEDAGLAERSNCVFMGTTVRSGMATALIVHTANNTVYGQISKKLMLGRPETEFERGIKHLGSLLIKIMVIIVVAVLSTNIVLRHPAIEMLLFAMALAVGLTPELLPAIFTITLARGAKDMAQRGVIVKRLNAIENLGSMDVLCTDKTGTLTEGVVQLDDTLDFKGVSSDTVLHLAYLNSRLQTGLDNPLDTAVIRRAEASDINILDYHKLDEIPYDFVRKRLSVVVCKGQDSQPLLITKGALQDVLEVCDCIQNGDNVEVLDDDTRSHIFHQFSDWSQQGYRVLGIAQKSLQQKAVYGHADEQAMVFMGFLRFFDPPEPGVRQTLDGLRRLGVDLKIITGDNRLVARHVAESVGMDVGRIVTGKELSAMKDEALWQLAPRVTLFAEVDPNQKERIILALQKAGHVVGYLGDGINDAPALFAADVGISVDRAVDVAKESADFVLLEHDLEVLRQGIDEGRRTFANTLKYIFITTSANFGNMVSMALASLVLPFLPLLAKQILLNNFLSDIPALGIAGDNVDREWESTPHRWNIRMIRNFMITFGLVSSVFDFLTFWALLYLVGKAPELFRTGWFVESLLTELLVTLVVRTYKPFYKSRPGRFLFSATLAVMIITVLLPFLPVGTLFGFVALPVKVMMILIGITALYLIVSEAMKRIFYRYIS
ncbi:MAG: magnesium-translocating P-type ATPase [Candidatus Brocadia sp.]|nr:magnesium-translocating P-type ATPase [Candidatus Brocadia sp.]